MLVGTVDLRTPFLGDGGFRVLAHQKTRILCSFYWLDLILYSMLGKWRQVWFWGLLGTLFTFVGIWNLVVRILYGKSDDE